MSVRILRHAVPKMLICFLFLLQAPRKFPYGNLWVERGYDPALAPAQAEHKAPETKHH